jgi:hypothetical protein
MIGHRKWPCVVPLQIKRDAAMDPCISTGPQRIHSYQQQQKQIHFLNTQQSWTKPSPRLLAVAVLKGLSGMLSAYSLLELKILPSD